MKVWNRSVGNDALWRELLKNSPVFGNSLDYLLNRSIEFETARHFDLLHRHKGVIIPLNEMDKRAVGVQVRQIGGEKPKYLTYGKKPVAWPMRNLVDRRFNNPLFIVEGVFSAMLAWQNGFNAVATLGAGSVSSLADFLNENAAFKKNVYSLMDPDRAGLTGAVKLWNEAEIPAIMITKPPDELSETDWCRVDKYGPEHAVKGEANIVRKYFNNGSEK